MPTYCEVEKIPPNPRPETRMTPTLSDVSGPTSTVSHDPHDFVKEKMKTDCMLNDVAGTSFLKPLNETLVRQFLKDNPEIENQMTRNGQWSYRDPKVSISIHDSDSDDDDFKPENMEHTKTNADDETRDVSCCNDPCEGGGMEGIDSGNLQSLLTKEQSPDSEVCETNEGCTADNSRPDDEVASLETAALQAKKDVPLSIVNATGRLPGTPAIPPSLKVECEVAEQTMIELADIEADGFTHYMHYSHDIVKKRRHSVNYRLTLWTPTPPILLLRAENHRKKKPMLFEFFFFIILAIVIDITPEEITVTLRCLILCGVAVLPANIAPKWCGLHGEQKTAHGRSSNSGAEHGGSGRTSGIQGPSDRGDAEDQDDGQSGDRDKPPSPPNPHDQVGEVPSPRLRHGDIKDIATEIHVVLTTDGDASQRILAEMNRCLLCCVEHDEANCPSGFCLRLTSSVTHYQRRTCRETDCGLCRLVQRLVKFHLKEKNETDDLNNNLTDDDVLAFVHDSLPSTDLDLDDEMTVVAKPAYLGRGKEMKYSETVLDLSGGNARFDMDHNEGAVGGFLEDDPNMNHVYPEAGSLASDLGSIPEEFEGMVLSDQSAAANRSQMSSSERDVAPAKSIGQVDEVTNYRVTEEPVAMTSDSRYLEDSIYSKFYEDDRPRQRKPSRMKQPPLSLPAMVNRKKFVPVRPGHVGIGGQADLDRVCSRWEVLKDTGFQRWNRNVQLEAEGVFLDNDCVEEHSITVDGRYDEGVHWITRSMIGEGCFGKVYTCMDITTRALFCVKVIEIHNLEGSEIKIWGRLDHPGFCTLRGAMRDGERILIFMSYVGTTLRDFLVKENCLDARPGCVAERMELLQALDCLHQLLDALLFMEQLGIIHNDLKSENVLVDDDTGELKIIDFGMSYRMATNEKKYRPENNGVLGTPIIRSPERMRSEPYDCTADVWSVVSILRELLTGYLMWFPEYSDSTELTLMFKIGDLQEPPMNLVPASLGLPERVLDLFRLGWAINPAQRHHAKDLLQLVDGIMADLVSGALTYVEPVPPEPELMTISEESENEKAEASQRFSAGFIEDPTQTDPQQVAIKFPTSRFTVLESQPRFGAEGDGRGDEEGAVGGAQVLQQLGRHGLTIDVEPASLEGEDASITGGNVPNFLQQSLNASNHVHMNSVSQSIDHHGNCLNVPMLSILDKTHSSDSFSVPVTAFNNMRLSPRNLKSSDLGSSAQPSMELEIKMESGTTSGIDPDYHRARPGSYCPTSEKTDTSILTLQDSVTYIRPGAASESDDDDDVDGQMIICTDITAAASQLPSPEVQSVPFDQRSKGSSSNSDEMLQKFQTELVFDHLRRVSMNESGDQDMLMDYASELDAKSPSTPGTPTGSGFSRGSGLSRQSTGSTSERGRKISEEIGLRCLNGIEEGASGNSDLPVVVFHRGVRDSQANVIEADVIVTFSCSKGYNRQSIQDVVETVASKLHREFECFTIRHLDGRTLCLESTVGRILPKKGCQIHLLVVEADTETDDWYIIDHEVNKASVYH